MRPWLGRERLAGAIIEATAAQARLTEEQQRSAELAAQLGGALGDALGGALTDFQDIDQIGLQFLSTLISIVAQAALLGPLTRGLESGNFAGGVFDLFSGSDWRLTSRARDYQRRRSQSWLTSVRLHGSIQTMSN